MTVAVAGDAPEPHRSLFDSLKREDEFGEWWSARDLMPIYGYRTWQSFSRTIDQAKLACATSAHDVSSNFSDITKIDNHRHKRADFRVTRYAAYLIAMEGDANKPQIAQAKTYFAVQTRRTEVGIDALDPELRAIHDNLVEIQKVRNEQRVMRERQEAAEQQLREHKRLIVENTEASKATVAQVELARREVAENRRLVEEAKQKIIEHAGRLEDVELVTPLKDRTGLQSTKQVAQLLGWGEIRLMTVLREELKIIYRDTEGGHKIYQKYLDAGWGSAKYVAWPNGKGHSWMPLWSAKGVVEIQRRTHATDGSDGRLF